MSFGQNFVQIGKKSPCDGCPAPCCTTQVFLTRTPRTYMDLDWMSYTLNFPRTEILFYENQDFAVLKWEGCKHLNSESLCSVHNTPEQPKTCVFYNPHHCWYFRNFTTDRPLDMVRMNRARFDLWTQHIQLDTANLIVSAPSFVETRNLLEQIPIFPVVPPRKDMLPGGSIMNYVNSPMAKKAS